MRAKTYKKRNASVALVEPGRDDGGGGCFPLDGPKWAIIPHGLDTGRLSMRSRAAYVPQGPAWLIVLEQPHAVENKFISLEAQLGEKLICPGCDQYTALSRRPQV